MAAFGFIFSLMFLPYTLTPGESCKNHPSEYGFALVDHVYKSFTADRLASCYIACNMQPACQSLNHDLVDKTCEFNNDTKYYRAKYFVEKATSVYADNPDSESPWRKLDSAPVCFGSKGDEFGLFKVEFGGSVETVKLVHLHGLVRCNRQQTSTWSKWGCGHSSLHGLITTSTNVILLPKNQRPRCKIPGCDSNSPEIVFENLSSPLVVTSGQELRLWYSKDLMNESEEINNGRSCTYVFAEYI